MSAARALGLRRLLLAQGELRRAAEPTGVILSAGAVFFQAWALRNSIGDLEQKIGPKAIEAQLGIATSGIGVMAASAELVGNGLKALGLELGEKLAKRGALVGAATSAIDAIQAFAAWSRTAARGDDDAEKRYLLAGIFYSGATIAGIWAGATGSAALFGPILGLGPLGLALVLIAAGVVATWSALNAEDTQMEIWLDRCLFGYGKRGQSSLVDAKWTDTQIGQEMAALNAIMAGLSGKMGFSNRWLWLQERITGFEEIELEITFANFDESVSEYEWTLQVRNISNGRDVPVVRGFYRPDEHSPRPLVYNARPG